MASYLEAGVLFSEIEDMIVSQLDNPKVVALKIGLIIIGWRILKKLRLRL